MLYRAQIKHLMKAPHGAYQLWLTLFPPLTATPKNTCGVAWHGKYTGTAILHNIPCMSSSSVALGLVFGAA